MDTGTFKSDLKTAFQNAAAVTDPNQGDAALETLCGAIGDAVEKYLKTAKVTVTAITGQIAVQGGPAAQANVASLSISGAPDDPTGAIGGIS